MSDPLVWLPFDPALLDPPPSGLRYEVVDPTEHVPDSVDEVEVYVPPYQMKPAVADVLPRMTNLRLVQTLSAGVDNVRARIPDGVTLCNGRGIHDASTAELALTLILASLRGIPGFVRAQDRARVDLRLAPRAGGPAGADRGVRRHRRGDRAPAGAVRGRGRPRRPDAPATGVHAIDELPALLPDADVVVLVVPLTDATRGLVDAEFLARMKDGALLVNVARGAVVVTDDLVAALHSGRISAATDVTEVEPLPADHAAVVGAEPADLAARGRVVERHVAPGPPAGPRAAGAVRRGRAAGQRDDRRLLSVDRRGPRARNPACGNRGRAPRLVLQ